MYRERCPECKKVTACTESHGSVWCSVCNVEVSPVVIDRGPESRYFPGDDGPDPCRVGEPTSRWSSSSPPGLMIGPGPNAYSLRRVQARVHAMAFRECRQRADLSDVRDEINGLAKAMRLSDATFVRAEALCGVCLGRGSHAPKASIYAKAVACVFAACREKGSMLQLKRVLAHADATIAPTGTVVCPAETNRVVAHILRHPAFRLRNFDEIAEEVMYADADDLDDAADPAGPSAGPSAASGAISYVVSPFDEAKKIASNVAQKLSWHGDGREIVDKIGAIACDSSFPAWRSKQAASMGGAVAAFAMAIIELRAKQEMGKGAFRKRLTSVAKEAGVKVATVYPLYVTMRETLKKQLVAAACATEEELDRLAEVHR